MKSSTTIFRHEFVTSVPDKMDEGVLYVSIPFSTTMHLCPCGCGSEIVNKLSPARWKLIYDGENVSLSPSIGNWSLACKSHYWICKNQIQWAASWSDEKISKARKKDKKENKKYFRKKKN
jgi:hypothetical protein